MLPHNINFIDEETALNYVLTTGNPYLDVNDTVDCILPIYGCMDSLAYNYDDQATIHDESCIPTIYGCTDNGLAENMYGNINDLFNDSLPSYNYDSSANTDDGSFLPIISGCIDTIALILTIMD